ETVVLAHEAKDGDKSLCAYYVPANISDAQHQESPTTHHLPPTTSIIRTYLAQFLPDYMIPTYIINLEKIPLTPNGKIDHRALSLCPVSGSQAQTHTAPRDKTEEKMAKIWADILAIPQADIGIDEDFFQKGGHSLKATIMASRIHKEFNIKLPLTEIFRHSTIRTLADR
ncbi:MAG: hypothetical protein GY765_24110, partial [bacterium]|nr:hypothetical protein [bacterium]